MRFPRCKFARYTKFLLPPAVALLTAVPAWAQTAAPTDTVSVPPSSTGRVKIHIGEHGISVEGNTRVPATSDSASGRVEIYDHRGGKFHEKGLDIVKFGASVWVKPDELVRGDLVVFGGTATVEGKVIGNAVVIGGDLLVHSGAEIKGDAVVLGGKLEDAQDAIIRGERVEFNGIGLLDHWPVWDFPNRTFKLLVIPVGFFVNLILSFLVLLFLRGRIENSKNYLTGGFLKSFGAGLLFSLVGVFALLIVIIPLFITIVGIPLALLLMVSCVGVFIIAWTIFVYAVGGLLARKLQIESSNPFLIVFIGSAVLQIPDLIAFGLSIPAGSVLRPVAMSFMTLGCLLRCFAYLAGFGALAMSRFGGRDGRDERDERDAPAPALPPTPEAPPAVPVT